MGTARKNNNRRSRYGLNRGPEGVQEILGSVLRRSGLDQDIAKYNFIVHWPEIVGEKIAKFTKPGQIKGDCLVVHVNDSSWAQELKFYESVIVGRVNKYLSKDMELKRLFFLVS